MYLPTPRTTLVSEGREPVAQAVTRPIPAIRPLISGIRSTATFWDLFLFSTVVSLAAEEQRQILSMYEGNTLLCVFFPVA